MLGVLWYSVLIVIFVIVIILYIATGEWLTRHGGIDRWRWMLMHAVFSAVLCASVALVAFPLGATPFMLALVLVFIGFGAPMGAIAALFIKIPPRARRRK
jgi:hypothetical protein